MFLDTGGLVALARPEDRLRPAARGILASAVGPIVVTEYVLWETLNALSRVRDRERGHAMLNPLKAAPRCVIIPASARLWHAGLSLHRDRPDKDWSLTDCISFVVMKERGIVDALAHDHH